MADINIVEFPDQAGDRLIEKKQHAVSMLDVLIDMINHDELDPERILVVSMREDDSVSVHHTDVMLQDAVFMLELAKLQIFDSRGDEDGYA